MYKTIWAADDLLFDQLLSDAEKDGFTVVSFAPHWRFLSETSEYKEFKQTIFTALMHKPDTAPSPFMTANDFLAAMDAAAAARMMRPSGSDCLPSMSPTGDTPKCAPSAGAVEINLPPIDKQILAQLEKDVSKSVAKNGLKRRYIGGSE